MTKSRREDLEMKIPALLHLSRLGYGYLSRKDLRLRDRRTNFLPDNLRAAVERINGIALPPEAFEPWIAGLRDLPGAGDLGRGFYQALRNGWQGLALIDFAHPENNLFQCASELSCGSGSGSFRPDITLFVNGLPLAMIELKSGASSRGLQAEYDRMAQRFEGDHRTFLQCAQVWAFSDNQVEEPPRLLPTKGTFFATGGTEDFPVYPVRERQPGIYRQPLPRKPEEEIRILRENGLESLNTVRGARKNSPSGRTFRRNLSPQKPTHRMLTSLFHPERFLFLLRYGIQYVSSEGDTDPPFPTRRMLTGDQLHLLNSLKRKALRGYLNWTAPACGSAGEAAMNASLIALLRDLFPERECCWISADARSLEKDRAAFRSCGVPGPVTHSMAAAEALPKAWTEKQEDGPAARGRIFVLPPLQASYAASRAHPVVSRAHPAQDAERAPLQQILRRANPNAILISRSSGTVPEAPSWDSMMFYGDAYRKYSTADSNMRRS